MTIAIVQQSARAVYAGSGGASQTATATLSGVGATNHIIVVHSARAAPDGGGGHTVSVSDGTAYTQAAQIAVNDSGSSWTFSAIHYLENVGSGSHSIVGTQVAGAFNCYGWFVALEVSGLATSSSLDKTSTNSNVSSTNATTGSTGTLTQASELVIAAMAVQRGTNVTITLPSGFTNISNEPNTATYNSIMGSQDYLIAAATTAQNPDWGNFGASSPWAACIATFKAAAASGQPTMRRSGRFRPTEIGRQGTSFFRKRESGLLVPAWAQSNAPLVSRAA